MCIMLYINSLYSLTQRSDPILHVPLAGSKSYFSYRHHRQHRQIIKWHFAPKYQVGTLSIGLVHGPDNIDKSFKTSFKSVSLV